MNKTSRELGGGTMGKLLGGLLAVTVWAGAGHARAQSDRIELVADGQSPYVIAISESAPRALIAPAAELLQSSIERATGVTLPVVPESDVDPGAPAIYLGKTRAAEAAGVPLERAEAWNVIIQAVGRDIFLVGEDGPAPIKERLINIQGTLKAVVVFLEDQVGVRFVLPGTYGIRVPRTDRITVDPDLDVFREQLFEFAVGRSPRAPVYAVAMNLFGNSPVVRTYGGHSYYDAVPAEQYGESHPEYFALIGDVRTPTGNHLCITNPDVQRLMIEEMERQFDNGYQWVELAQTDGYQPCRCESCEALHPDIGERLWIVHRDLAEEMKRRRPEGRVMLLMYANTANPPTSFTEFPDNVVVQMTRTTPEYMEEWAPFNVDKSAYEIYWGAFGRMGYAPLRTPRFAVNQVRFLRDNRVRGIYVGGGWISAQGAFGLDGPSYYAFGKSLEHPDLNPDEVLNEYLEAAFGNAAAPMRAFFRGMFDRLELNSVFGSRRYLPTGGIPHSMGTSEDFFCHVFPPKLLGEMSANLQRAIEMADDEEVLAHLRLIEVEFGNVRTLAEVFHVYRAYRAAPSQPLLDALARRIEARKAWFDEVFPDGDDQRISIPGLTDAFIGATRSQVVNQGRGHFTRIPPFNWDFDFFREQNILPGAMPPKRMDVVRVEPIHIDGNIDKAPWLELPFEEMSEIGLGRAANPSRFKTAYDDEAFYVAIEFEYDDEGWLERLVSTGRDGNAWAQECVEILIDPFGLRERHVQLVFNPIEDSKYDARANFIDDPDHPLFGRRDDTWRGEWQYAARIDRENRRWTAEARIPFATLEVDTPAPGTLWTLNIGRAEWPVPRDNHGVRYVRYSTWSPNMEGRSFHDRASYGEAVFR